MSDVYDRCTQGKRTININYNAAFQIYLAYNLVHLNLLRPITLVDYNGSKYSAFLTNDLLHYQ